MKRFFGTLLLAGLLLVSASALGDGLVADVSLLITGESFGPGVSALLVELTAPAAEVSLADAAVQTAGEAREVTEVYLCDEAGARVEGPSDRMAVVLDAKPMYRCSPMTKDPDSGMTVWAEHYPVTLTGRLTVDGTDTDLTLDADCIDRRVCPDSDRFAVRWDFTGAYANPLTGETETVTLRLAAYEPEALAGGGRNPLIVWLHGYGEGGEDMETALLGNEVTALAESGIQQHFTSADGTTGAYVLIPQCSTMWMDGGDGQNSGGTAPSRYSEALEDAIRDYLAKHPDVDPDRVYLGGCSNGGYMTMNLLRRAPGFFAAAFPVCEALPYVGSAEAGAGLTDDEVDALVDQPVWFVQSADDNVVDPAKFVLPVCQQLIFAGNTDCWLSMFASYGHSVWVAVFQDRVGGTQDMDLVSEELTTEPDNDCGGALDAEGFTNLFDWLNSHSLGIE